MPGLNLLAEYGDKAIPVLGKEGVAERGRVYSFEEFRAEWAHIVKICILDVSAVGAHG